MKQWTKEIEIHAPVEEVWSLFDGSLENMQKIMPQVIEHKPVKVTEGGIGSIYRQKYQEGKRVEEYEVETLEYMDAPGNKVLKVGFTIANMFEITAAYELIKMNENKTHFRYTATNKPLKWYIKPLIVLASSKVVVTFVERVKRVAEEEAARPSVKS
ncbi:SRPBCC family protein [Alteribacillus sp. HJP-4]|uniref:SRPBCC family protein n=1 Tax=Alteribacillus sp. HJP-4 TaxID=2775394 RepID=UPI0035CD1B37